MKIILLIIFSSYALFVFSQKTVVQFDKGSIAYIGLNNPLTIMVENVSCNNIIVQSTHNKIVKDTIDQSKYIYVPNVVGKDTLNIYKKKQEE